MDKQKSSFYTYVQNEAEKKIIAKSDKRYVILTNLDMVKDSLAKLWDVNKNSINVTAQTNYWFGEEEPTQEQMYEALQNLYNQNEGCALIFSSLLSINDFSNACNLTLI